MVVEPAAEEPEGLRLCANLKWLFTEMPFEVRFAAAARAGFSGVEYASPYGLDAQRLAQLLAQEGLQQVLINTPVGAEGSATASGAACLPDHVPAFRDGVRRALEYAGALGCRLVHVQAGVLPSGVARARAAAVFQDNIAWAAREATAVDVRLVLEAINDRDKPGYFLRTQEQARDVAVAVGPGVGVLFDIYHCQVSQGDVARRLSDVMPWVAHVQVADPPARSEPGTGELGWTFLFRHLFGCGYRGWVGCEYAPAGETTLGLGWRDELTPGQPWR